MTRQSGTGQPRHDLTPTLVNRLRDGEEEAGALLDRLYRERMTRFCLGYLGRREEAQDAVQDVFYKVLRSESVPDDFRAWIYRLARNHCLDLLRGRERRRDDQRIPTDPRWVVSVTGQLTQLVRGERKAKLHRLVAALPEEHREVLRLRYAEGLSRSEIASVLDLSVSRVKYRIFDGLQRLRRHTSLKGGH